MVESKPETDAEKQRRKLKETMESIERSKKLLANIKKTNEETTATMEKTKQDATVALSTAKRVVVRQTNKVKRYEDKIRIATAEPLDVIGEDEDVGDNEDEDDQC